MERSKFGTRWPKPTAVLTAQQEAVRKDWEEYWLGNVSGRYTPVERFNHTYAMRSCRPGLCTLDIGAGVGDQLEYEASVAHRRYVALDIDGDLSERITSRYRWAETVVADCQERLPFPDRTFDRVLAIHVLEHLPNLPACLNEVHRVLRPGGTFSVVIPCEGGWVYSLGRRLTSQRHFERRYRLDYRPIIAATHCNRPREILTELRRRFRVTHRRFWPWRVPLVDVNVLIGIELHPH